MKVGWRVKALGELCRIELGSTPARNNSRFWDMEKETSNVWLSIADLRPGLHPVCNDSKEYVSDEAARNMRIVPRGTLLVSFKLTLGRLAYAGRDLFTNEAIASLLDIDESILLKEYLYWALTVFDWHAAAEGDHKIKGKTLNKKKLKLIPIPLPPLEEQKQIVAILDEAFEGLDRARANVEANLEDAARTYEEMLGTLAIHDAADYGTVSLSELTSDVTDGDHMPPPKSETGVPFITISNINKQTGKIDFSRTFTVPDSYYSKIKQNRKPRAGDVLFTVTGSFGIPVLVSTENKFCFQRHIALIRPLPDINSEWLYFILMSPFVFDQANRGATGTAQRTVSLKLLRGLNLPNTPLSLQSSRVDRLRAIWNSSQSVIQIYRAKLSDLADLRQSLLQKAFAGELT